MRVSELLSHLLARFPKASAEPWDHIGLSVGAPASEVAGVCCALDATERNIRRTHDAGANVLLTHHPVYIKAPDAFTPADPSGPSSAAAVYTAARLGISVISLHTNLDRSVEAREALPALVGAAPSSSLEHEDPAELGLGAVCEIAATSLGDFAQRVADAFWSDPRVWGEPDRPLSRVAFLGGSLGGFGELAIARGCSAVVTGEAGYHTAQDLALRGCPVIALGHDRSEEPFRGILARACAQAGVPQDRISSLRSPVQWRTYIGKDSHEPR